MANCRTVLKKELPPEDKAKWDEAKAIMTTALDKLEELGLSAHVAYHTNFFLGFKDSREYK